MIMLRWRQPNEILKTKETIDTSHVQSFKKSVFLDLAKVHFSQEGPKIKKESSILAPSSCPALLIVIVFTTNP